MVTPVHRYLLLLGGLEATKGYISCLVMRLALEGRGGGVGDEQIGVI